MIVRKWVIFVREIVVEGVNIQERGLPLTQAIVIHRIIVGKTAAGTTDSISTLKPILAAFGLNRHVLDGPRIIDPMLDVREDTDGE